MVIKLTRKEYMVMIKNEINDLDYKENKEKVIEKLLSNIDIEE